MLNEYLITVMCHNGHKMALVVNMFTKYISCSCIAGTINTWQNDLKEEKCIWLWGIFSLSEQKRCGWVLNSMITWRLLMLQQARKQSGFVSPRNQGAEYNHQKCIPIGLPPPATSYLCVPQPSNTAPPAGHTYSMVHKEHSRTNHRIQTMLSLLLYSSSI